MVIVSADKFIGLFLKPLTRVPSIVWLSWLRLTVLILNKVSVVLADLILMCALLRTRVQLWICCSKWPVTWGALCEWLVTTLSVVGLVLTLTRSVV